MYSVRTRFNNIEMGGFFTFRKNGEANHTFLVDDCYRDCGDYNVRDLSGGASKINNTRSIVWTEPCFMINKNLTVGE